MLSGLFKELGRVGIFIASCVLILSLTLSVQGKEPDLSGIKAKYVQSLLQTAKTAVEEGEMEKARLLWLQIHSLNPSVSKPGWLEVKIASGSPAVYRSAAKNEAQVAETSQKKYFEAQLKANPFNREARKALYRIAQRDGDEIAMLRHKSILQPETVTNHNYFLKWALGVLLFAAILWLFFSPLPGSKDAVSQAGNNLFNETIRFFKLLFSKRP